MNFLKSCYSCGVKMNGDTMPAHVNSRIEKIQGISEKFFQKLAESPSEKTRLFAEIYFANVPPEDLEGIDEESLSSEILSMWGFAQHRKVGQAKVRVFNATIGEDATAPNKTILEIITDNTPFIVDSVTSTVNALGRTINLLTHPVVLVERDGRGDLISIHPRSEDVPECIYESFVRCEINKASSPKRLQQIEDEINQVLSDVKNAVSDWHKITAKVHEAITNLEKQPLGIEAGELEEVTSFLKWLADHHFTFLGYCEYDFVQNNGMKRKIVSHDGLGILKDPAKQELTQLFEGVDLSPQNRRFLIEPYPLLIAKTTQTSTVHRRNPMDSITVKRYDDQGNVIGMSQFFGLFTSVVYNRSTREIPLLRCKIKNILLRSGFSEEWHDGKALLHILETFPRDELFQSSEMWLFDTSMAIVHLQNRQRMALFIRQDQFDRYVSCLVYVPRDRYDSDLRNKIQEILAKEFKGTVSSWQVQLGELAFARLHVVVQFNKEAASSTYDVKAIEQKLARASLTWKDELNQDILTAYGENVGISLFEKYMNSFSRGYEERFDTKTAVIDIDYTERALEGRRVHARVYPTAHKGKEYLQMKVYSPSGPIALSDILPVLECLNLKVLSEIPFNLSFKGHKSDVWIQSFELMSQDGFAIDLKSVEKPFLEAFERVWSGEAENDGYNRLIIRAEFTWREAQIFRAYGRYLKQLSSTYSQSYIQEALIKNGEITKNILDLFKTRFDPVFKGNREKAQEKLLSAISAQLNDVRSIDEDRILNRFMNAILSTLRTNYFQEVDGAPKAYFSFKISCASIDEMPLPRPVYEVFVYSSRMEGVHLRGGKVARGGLRWSDRPEDFRTEILGLIKAQIVKNAVIVPVGSKGGFVVKQMPISGNRDEVMAEVVECYRTLIRGLLDLTDNLKKGKVIHPLNVVRWDEDDPYLVVAADKGTATFSDYANAVSKEYNFWLGDAFASGGSAGYDHKKMAITAKGAWESVKHHFGALGIDPESDPITTVGVGDMAGDVFGNGMLCSRTLKLVAAFNHMHIFIDPNPDPEKSFKERQRMFNLPRSSWMDYDPKFISVGGGVFERQSKSITLTPEIKTLFGLTQNAITPNDLIQTILKSQVDLIWLGGIGTFVKARGESNADVGDRTNDPLRINGSELRATVVAEGANLGFTQRGRIEFALNGGRINTDAIDNSAGVDCSDHEVNIKILYGSKLEDNSLTEATRNQELESMTDDVSRLVLKDNVWQNRAISTVQSQGHRLLDEQVRLIHELEDEGLLNRALEFLPDDVELKRRLTDKQGLTRPELAVLLAYAKISLYGKVLESDLPDSTYLTPKLMGYFPSFLQKKYEKDIENHALKREIVATIVTNSVVNRMGMTFVNDLEAQTGRDEATIVRGYLIVKALLGLEEFWATLDQMDGQVSGTVLSTINFYAYKRVKRLTKWFMRYGGKKLNIKDALDTFNQPFEQLRLKLEDTLSPRLRARYTSQVEIYVNEGIDLSFAKRLASLDPLWSGMDIITIAQSSKYAIEDTARVYYALGEALGVDWLRDAAAQLSGDTRWEQGASSAIVDDFMISQKAITLKVLKAHKSIDAILDEEGVIREEILMSGAFSKLLKDLMGLAHVDLSMLTLASRSLRMVAEDAA